MAIIGKDIHKAISLLNVGELVAIPTETVYGLAANCLHAKAVARIFEVKNRPHLDPLIAHTNSIEKVRRFTKDIPEKGMALAEKLWPGPLTLILNKSDEIPDIVTSGLDTIAFRIPGHPFTNELLSLLEYPLAAPSANPFGYISPTTAFHVQAQLGERIDYIIDGGPCTIGIESTIVDVTRETPVILRLGGTSVETIKDIIGEVEIQEHSSSNPIAPGMLQNHYAPHTQVIVGNVKQLLENIKGMNVGLMTLERGHFSIDADKHFVLSETGDLNEAATRLFSGLRHLDQLGVQLILAEYVPEYGLGRAINDRLRRAAARKD